MANPSDVFTQLNDKIFARHISKNADVTVDDDTESLDEDQASKRFLGHYVRRGQGEYRKGDRGDVKDVDTLNAGDVDDEYVTHKTGDLPYSDYSSFNYQPYRVSAYEQIKQTIEQAMQAPPPEQAQMQQQPGPEEVGAAAAGGDPAGGAVDTPEEVGAQAAQPPEMGGIPDETLQPGLGQPLPEEDVSKSPSDLGRIYELKKIYTRLTVIEAFLTESSDTKLIETRTIVSKAIELFEILASNLSSYKPPRAPEETLDEVIVQYYRFLEKIYESVAKYYKSRSREQINAKNLPPEAPKIKIDLPFS
jgi:hypothetical protein